VKGLPSPFPLDGMSAEEAAPRRYQGDARAADAETATPASAAAAIFSISSVGARRRDGIGM